MEKADLIFYYFHLVLIKLNRKTLHVAISS